MVCTTETQVLISILPKYLGLKYLGSKKSPRKKNSYSLIIFDKFEKWGRI